MGIYDRDYTQDNYDQNRGRRMVLPPLTPMVKRLIIINFVVYFAGLIFFGNDVIVHGIRMTKLEQWFAVLPISLANILQVWRLITYQFLHDMDNISHIIFNMLGLYFLGPTLEQYWGSKKFIKFYLACGTAGGIFYTLLAQIHYLDAVPMVGASGAILGMLAACAILFPHFVVFFLFFPLPIRVASIAITIIYFVNLYHKGQNAGGDAAHLAGLAAGAGYVFLKPLRARLKLKIDR